MFSNTEAAGCLEMNFRALGLPCRRLSKRTVRFFVATHLTVTMECSGKAPASLAFSMLSEQSKENSLAFENSLDMKTQPIFFRHPRGTTRMRRNNSHVLPVRDSEVLSCSTKYLVLLLACGFTPSCLQNCRTG